MHQAYLADRSPPDLLLLSKFFKEVIFEDRLSDFAHVSAFFSEMLLHT
jgi:hypothetical protein